MAQQHNTVEPLLSGRSGAFWCPYLWNVRNYESNTIWTNAAYFCTFKHMSSINTCMHMYSIVAYMYVYEYTVLYSIANTEVF